MIRPVRRSTSPAVAEDFGLNPQEIGFDRGRATKSPQQRCQTKYEFTLDRRSCVVVGNNCRFESAVIVDILDYFDHGFSA